MTANRLYHSRIIRLAAVLLVALAWSNIAFCGEIHDAANSGNLEKIKALLKDHPDLVFSKDDKGRTALHMAAAQGNKELVELLLANKADVNAKDNDGKTPLQYAANGTEAAMSSLDAGGPPKFTVTKGHKNVEELLRKHGGSAGLGDIHEAANKGDLERVQALLKANPDLVFDKDFQGHTPLHAAASSGNKELVKLLLANKADVNAKTIFGTTPLHYAASSGNKEVVELLLANKADVNAKDLNGDTPLQFAASSGKKEVAELLRQHVGHQ